MLQHKRWYGRRKAPCLYILSLSPLSCTQIGMHPWMHSDPPTPAARIETIRRAQIWRTQCDAYCGDRELIVLELCYSVKPPSPSPPPPPPPLPLSSKPTQHRCSNEPCIRQRCARRYEGNPSTMRRGNYVRARISRRLATRLCGSAN